LTTTVYGHLSRWTVTVGQAVRTGQLIAYSGNEGRSTGPHLHFEVRPNDRSVDPLAFYAAHGSQLP
jgi:murein DD-endopeptidase MepM/ murein hydrolase activator NlpD